MAFDVVTLLDQLFQQAAGSDRPAAVAARRERIIESVDLPPDWHLLWDERAAIMEYHGEMPREQAEALALEDIRRQMERAETK